MNHRFPVPVYSRKVERKVVPVRSSGFSHSKNQESLVIRGVIMLSEMVWLIGAMTIQINVGGYRGYSVVFLMLAAYVFYFHERLRVVPNRVWLLAAALVLASIGGQGTGSVNDVYKPIHMAFVVVAVMGVFLARYHRRTDVVFLAGPLMGLLLAASFQSVQRNNLLELWADNQRHGVNLQGLFIMLAIAYGFCLKARWKMLTLPLYLALIFLGSRTAFITAVAFPVAILLIDKDVRRKMHRSILPLGMALIGVLVFLSNVDMGGILKSAGLPVAYQRMFDETVVVGVDTRKEVVSYWFGYLVRNPTLFGNGIDTYSGRLGALPPDNGYLHVFNGLGVICGVVYFCIVINASWFYIRSKTVLPTHFAWAGAFVIIMLLRKITEGQILVEPTHVAGFAVIYATGLAIWGAERLPDLASRQARLRRIKPQKMGHGDTKR